jgi:uncharacterized protein (DUF433 family)
MKRIREVSEVAVWREAKGHFSTKKSFPWSSCALITKIQRSRGMIRQEDKTMNAKDFIEVRPDVMLGKPVIRGTRIPVELVVRKLGEGATMEDLLDGYPTLSKEKIMAALIYAADLLGNEKILFLKTGTAE